MSQNIVVKGKIDGLSNSKITDEYSIYNTMSIEQENGQISHFKNVIVVGGMTSYLQAGFKGKIFIRKINDNKHLILALENENGKKILDDSELRKRFKDAQGSKKSAYIAMVLGVVFLPIIIGVFFIASGLAHLGPASKDYELFDFNSIEPFLKDEGFQIV